MLKKIILFLLISSIVVAGFAQKNRKKNTAKNPKSEYFVMLVNGEETPAERYCPNEDILFTFKQLNEDITHFDFKWHNSFNNQYYFDDSVTFSFPITSHYPIVSNYKVSLFITFELDSTIVDTLMNNISIDVIRTTLDTSVCQGRCITVHTLTHGDTTYCDVQADITTPWDTLVSASGCDSLVHWYITMHPYIIEKYSISSCDSVIWGDTVVKRPSNYDGDYTTKPPIERIFLADDPDNNCDTIKFLTVTIIDKHELTIVFDQNNFCSGDDMGGTINLETNFTAFDWNYYKNKENKDKKQADSTYHEFLPKLEIENSGYYEVVAYMDTSLYDTLRDLRIVNCSLSASLLVEDCPLIFPNIITPNEDGYNDILGIKKLNPNRENELTIYDRWGKNVFHQKNYQCVFKKQQYENIEDAFAGLSRGGQKLPDGTYYYAFFYDALPKKKTYSGTLVILRDK